MNDIYEGMTIHTSAFGDCAVYRLRCDGQIMYAECKSPGGESLFLSLRYIRRLIGA